jgi:hypothetical protein
VRVGSTTGVFDGASVAVAVGGLVLVAVAEGDGSGVRLAVAVLTTSRWKILVAVELAVGVLDGLTVALGGTGVLVLDGFAVAVGGTGVLVLDGLAVALGGTVVFVPVGFSVAVGCGACVEVPEGVADGGTTVEVQVAVEGKAVDVAVRVGVIVGGSPWSANVPEDFQPVPIKIWTS